MSNIKSDYKSWLDFLEYGICKGESPFLRFAILWLSFNAYLNEEYGEKISGDKKKVLEFAKNEQVGNFYEDLLKDPNFNEVVSDFKATKIPERLFVEDMQSRQENNRKLFDDNHKSIKDYLMVIYQIRCNFFHGDKIPYYPDDKRVIEWAYKYFYILWSEYLNFINKEKIKKI